MSEYSVLLIDDEEELVSTLVVRLGYRGVKAQYALNGEDGLRMLREEKFNVVVLDLKLPGMSGMEILQVINREYPDLPVLLITGHGSPDDVLEEKPEGIFDYLAKPINLEDLMDKMKEAIGIK
jgi:DNA-binding NtrC family response regulator